MRLPRIKPHEALLPPASSTRLQSNHSGTALPAYFFGRTISLTVAATKYYLNQLKQYRKRYSFTVYAYVLMSNHVHLLIETGKVPLSKIMQGLQSRYTGYYNRNTKK
jgi:REP element-mobilizing transposase RayT